MSKRTIVQDEINELKKGYMIVDDICKFSDELIIEDEIIDMMRDNLNTIVIIHSNYLNSIISFANKINLRTDITDKTLCLYIKEFDQLFSVRKLMLITSDFINENENKIVIKHMKKQIKQINDEIDILKKIYEYIFHRLCQIELDY